MRSELTAQYFDLVAAVNKIRNQIDSHSTRILSRKDYRLIEEALSPFKSIRTVEVFLEDCVNCVDRPLNFSTTRDYAFQKEEPIVLSFFNAPYNKAYGLDAFVYEIEMPDPYFVSKFRASKATSINLIRYSQGFDQYPTCVALFPENFCTTKDFKDSFSVFYFVNVFERRFQEYGRPTLDKFVNNKCFWRLKRLSKESRLRAFATWHYLHEHFHSTGNLPLVDHLRIKSSRKAAAIEESRVDVLSILECLESAKRGFSDGLIYAELILFERLIRYSIHSKPDENYDATSSYILLGFLQNLRTVSFEEMAIGIDRLRLKESLEHYIEVVDGLEMDIKAALTGAKVEELKLAARSLSGFADKNCDHALQLKDRFFNNIREELNLINH